MVEAGGGRRVGGVGLRGGVGDGCPGHATALLSRRAAVVVGICNFAYHPFLLHVEKGARVTFENRDGAAHDAMRKGSFSTLACFVLAMLRRCASPLGRLPLPMLQPSPWACAARLSSR